MCEAAARAFLRDNIRSDLSLQQIYSGKASARVANDTSFGAGYAPYSELERGVLHLAATLKSGPFRQAFPAAGDDFKITGLSAEMGDDGQVGRGNRVNGLITPGRPMSLEAAAGKNPAAHVGKLYNVLAHVTAHAICREIPEVREATVKIVSMIGRPVDQPQAVAVDVSLSSEASPALPDRIRALVSAQFDGMDELTRRIVHGEIPVY